MFSSPNPPYITQVAEGPFLESNSYFYVGYNNKSNLVMCLRERAIAYYATTVFPAEVW